MITGSSFYSHLNDGNIFGLSRESRADVFEDNWCRKGVRSKEFLMISKSKVSGARFIANIKSHKKEFFRLRYKTREEKKKLKSIVISRRRSSLSINKSLKTAKIIQSHSSVGSVKY